MSSMLDSDLWKEGLKLISFCPVCEARYSSMEARMINTESETRLVHITCRKCQNSVLAVVMLNQAGASSIGLLTDLSYEDVLLFGTLGCMSIDDVIGVHTFFNEEGWENKLGKPSFEELQKVRRKVRPCEIKAQKNNAAR